MNGDKPQAPEEGNWQFKSDTADTAPAPTQETVSDQTTAAAPAPVVPAPITAEIPPQFMAEQGASLDEPESPEVSWSASEFIAHEKSPLWYMGLAAVAAVLVLFVFFLFHDMVASFAIIFVAILFGFLAAHKPRVLNYHVDAAGLTIERKMYSFGEFKSFGVVNEGAFSSITFMPMKRFMPSLSIYYPPENEEDIVNVLSNYLPFAPASHDLVDRLMHRIRL